MPTLFATITGILLFLVVQHPATQTLRCEMEDSSTEWMQVSPQAGRREWEGENWGPPLCGQRLESTHQVEHWECRFDRQHHVLTYTATDRRSGGIYQRVETLDVASGQYHHRIVDGTHVPDGGKRLVLGFRGRCEAWLGEPLEDVER